MSSPPPYHDSPPLARAVGRTLQGRMSARLAVGVETNCTAPLRLERASMRLFRLMGVDSMFVPDHYLSFIPRSLWKPEYTPAAKVVPSPDAYFDPCSCSASWPLATAGCASGRACPSPSAGTPRRSRRRSSLTRGRLL
jgi:hypothetical protein